MTEPMESAEEHNAAMDRIESDFEPTDVVFPDEKPDETFTLIVEDNAEEHH